MASGYTFNSSSANKMQGTSSTPYAAHRKQYQQCLSPENPHAAIVHHAVRAAYQIPAYPIPVLPKSCQCISAVSPAPSTGNQCPDSSSPRPCDTHCSRASAEHSREKRFRYGSSQDIEASWEPRGGRGRSRQGDVVEVAGPIGERLCCPRIFWTCVVKGKTRSPFWTN